MYDVVAVSFIGSNRIYYFSTNNLDLSKGMNVIVDTERGLQYAVVVTDVIQKSSDKLILLVTKPSPFSIVSLWNLYNSRISG